MNALTDPKVGKYLNEHFVSAFQKVGTFRIVGGGQKQGGNVASYFCAQDGRVLHVIPGPVNSATLLKEARWVVDTVQTALKENAKSGKSFKSQLREAHAKRLLNEHGLTIEPVKFDAPTPGESSALTYRDPSGKPLAPVLPRPPVEGPNVSFTPAQVAAFNAQQVAIHKELDEAKRTNCTAKCGLVVDRRGRRWGLNNQGRAHMLLAAHSMKKIETMYGSIFEGILGERVSTKPVQVVNPFPWVQLRGAPNGGQLQANPR